MDNNWKNNLLDEIETYSKQINSFCDKWDVNVIQKIIAPMINQIDGSEHDINLLDKVDESDKKLINEYVDDYVAIAINSQETRIVNRYVLLMQLLAVIGMPINVKYFLPTPLGFEILKLDGSFSAPCRRMFIKQCSDVIMTPLTTVKQDCVDYNVSPYNIHYIKYQIGKAKGGKGVFIPKLCLNNSPKTEKSLCVVNQSFLSELKDDLMTKEYSSLMDFAIMILKKYDVEVSFEMRDLKRLYEETPDQICVSEQRFYQEEKIIDERNEKIREEERREEALREEQERQKRQMEEEWWRQEEARERAEKERREREYQEHRRQREENERMQEQARLARIRQDELDAQEAERERQMRIAARDREEQEIRYREQQYKTSTNYSNTSQNQQSNAQANALIDAQIAQLEREAFNLHGPNDGEKLLAVRSEIRRLRFLKK